jgi:dihydropteroate synthase
MPPIVMGIVNASADSFANGGVAQTLDDAHRMIAEGAAILDVGGESTRPGADVVAPDEEQARVLPLIAALAGRGAAISVDTRNASTMRAAIDAGASMVNDVSGLTHDPAAAAVVARAGCRVVLMHMRGTPQTMTTLTQYQDVVADVIRELAARVAAAEHAGIARHTIIVDPGLGFAKTAAQNLELLRRLDEFAVLGLPILVGASRKSFIGAMGGEADPQRRVPGSIAAALFALQRGAGILRVHDVGETVQAIRVWDALTEHATSRGPAR